MADVYWPGEGLEALYWSRDISVFMTRSVLLSLWTDDVISARVVYMGVDVLIISMMLSVLFRENKH